jgi:PAS domain S-box-containing protein
MCSSTVAELLEGERHFQALADFVPHLMWIADGDGWIYWYNKRWYDYTGTAAGQMKGWGWQAVHDPGVLPEVVEQWKRSIATGEPFEMVFPLRGADGAFRPFLTRALPLKTESGAVLRWFGTNTDVSEQKRAEERLRLLVNELNHRVKNTLASVQALASRSLKKSPDDGSKPFHDRLAALARAHDMLVQSKWEPADLRELARKSLSPLGAGANERITIEGSAVLIPADRAPVWSMALYELGANALEHGALRHEAGRIEISWQAAEGRLRFCWSENGAPAAAPERRGFGTCLLENLGRELGGSTLLQFTSGGLVCNIEVPLPSNALVSDE